MGHGDSTEVQSDPEVIRAYLGTESDRTRAKKNEQATALETGVSL
jgi:hypothetical protein